MITIERVYYPKKEFKLLYQGLRYMLHLECYTLPNNKRYLERDMTDIIDCYVLRWKYQKMSTNTMHKLHRFAIAYRHNALQGTK